MSETDKTELEAEEVSETQADAVVSEDNATPPKRRVRKPRRGWVAFWVLLPFVLIVSALAYVVDRQLDAPDWMRTEIETRIAEALPGINVDFGRMSLVVQRSGLARVILWDVDIRNQRGEPIAALADIEAGLSPTGLLRGQTVLREAQVSGAFVTLQRDAMGNFGLALGDAFASRTQSPEIGDVIAQIDRLFEDPRLNKLRSIDADALTIRYEDLRARRGWTADGGRLSITRDGEALSLTSDLVVLSGGADVATVALTGASPIGETSLEFGLSFEGVASADIASQSPALAWLKTLDAPISGSLRSGLSADGEWGSLDASLLIGSGVLQPNASTRPIPFDQAHAYFNYAPQTQLLRFSDVSVISALGSANASGSAQMINEGGDWPTGLVGQFRFSDLHLAKDILLEDDFRIASADMAFQLALENFAFDLGELRINDPDLPLSAKGRLLAANDGWDVALDVAAPRLTPAKVLSLWPKELGPKARLWVAENIVSGTLKDARFSLRAAPGADPVPFLDLGFEVAVLTYNKRLPRIENASGRMTIYDNRLGVRLSRGVSPTAIGGGITADGTTFTIPDLRQKPLTGRVSVAASGAVPAVLSYIDNDTWRVLSRNGRAPDLATGQAKVSGVIALPLLRGVKLAQMDMDLKAKLTNVRSSSLVPNRELSADALDVRLSETQVSVAGPVSLSGVEAKGEWTLPFKGGESVVTAKVDIDAAGLKRFGIALPDGSVSGAGTGDLTITLPKGEPPRFELRSALAGIGLSIPQLGWSKGRNSKGDLQVSGRLSQPAQIDGISLKAAGLTAQGDVTLNANGGLDQLALTTLKIDDWLNAPVVLSGRGANRAPAVKALSGKVDMRRASLGAGRGSGGGVPLDLALDRLQVTKSITLHNFKGDLNTDGGLAGRFSGSIGGDAPIEGQAVPGNGGSAFTIEGRDAGDALKAAGIFKSLADGAYELSLTPVMGRKGHYDGAIRIKGPRISNAPAIGDLLDAISIVGILDQANGPGIYFDEIEAEFRMTPTQVIVTRSHAVGPSMGVTIDGYYDLASGQMDMQGVLSPVYFLNSIGRLIAREGEGLIGFNFDLRGTAANPITSVNPLSVFTPGMFRDIFRRPPPNPSQ